MHVTTHSGGAGGGQPTGPTGPDVVLEPVAPRLRTWPARALAVAIVALLLTAGVIVARPRPVDAEARLAAAVAAVEAARSFSFELTDVSSGSYFSELGAGTEYRTTIRATGTVVGDDFQVTSDSGDWVNEMVRIGDTAWSRFGATGDDEQWVEMPAEAFVVGGPDDVVTMYEDYLEWAEPEELDDIRAEVATSWFFMHEGGDPLALTRLVTDATGPELVSTSPGETVLRASVMPPAELAAIFEGGLEPLEVTITLDGDDLPRRITSEITSGTSWVEVDLLLAGWGEPLLIEPPDPEAVDHTPWIHEERIVELLGTPVAPAELPEGTVLQSAHVWSDMPMPGDCGALMLSYGTDDPPTGTLGEALAAAESDGDPFPFELPESLLLPGLEVTVTTAACADAVRWPASDPGEFALDPELGWPTRTDEWGETQVLVGDQVVTATTYGRNLDLSAVYRSLRPHTVEELAAGIDGSTWTGIWGW